MGRTLSFRFVDEKLNRCLIRLLKKKGITHKVDEDGLIHYSADDEEFVENELIGSVRDEVFPSWKVLSCPKDWTERYKRYMVRHNIMFQEELANHEQCFLIPSTHRPHSWKLEIEVMAKEPLSSSKHR